MHEINNVSYNLDEVALLMKQKEKIKAIKVLIDLTGLGLVAAKEYIESIDWDKY